MHWAADYIGIAWEYGATGPFAYDCWNFVRMVQERHYGVHLPEVAYDPDNWRNATEEMLHHPEHQNWEQVYEPQDGDVVMMARNRLPLHIGLWINTGKSRGVLHCAEPCGVVFNGPFELRSLGWGSLKFYRHKK